MGGNGAIDPCYNLGPGGGGGGGYYGGGGGGSDCYQYIHLEAVEVEVEAATI